MDGHFVVIQEKCIKPTNMTSNTIYWHFMDQLSKLPTAIEKWIEEFPFLNETDFKRFFSLPYKTIRDTKIQTFQYKLLNNILPCRATLYVWKLTDNDKCQYCNSYDGLSHYFYECKVTKPFWKQLENWIYHVSSIKVPLSKVDIIFSIPFDDDDFLHSLNFIVMYGKCYIYKCKLENNNIFLLDFLVDLKNILVIEKYRTNIEGKDMIFNRILGAYYDELC